MKGKVVQFRRGLKRIHEKHFILDVNADSKEKAAKFAGKEVVWTSPAGKQIHGKISASHGNKGLVRAIFEKGLPGQARNTEVSIDSTLESKKIINNVKSWEENKINGGKTTMTKNHPVRGYEIHPVFHDLLDGLTFDLRVGEMGSPLSRLYPIANHETFRKFGDPTQKNYVRPCE